MKRAATATDTKAPTAAPSTATTRAMTPRADRTRGHVVRVFAERIRAALAFDLESGGDIVTDPQGMPYTGSLVHDAFIRWGYDPRDPGAVQEIAETWADHIVHVVAAYDVPARIRGAVALRLAEQWPWGDPPPSVTALPLEWTGDEPSYRRAMWRKDHHDTLSLAEYLMERAKIIPPRVMWPSNVSFDDVVATLERSTHPDARAVVQSCRDGRWSITLGGEATGLGVLRPGVWRLRDEANEYVPDPDRKGWLRLADANLTAALGTFFHPFSAALVAWAEKTHTEAHRRAAPFAVSSSRIARAATLHLSSTGKADREALPFRGGGLLRLKWDGRMEPVQLYLPGIASGDDFAANLMLRLDELSDGGLAVWLALHAMADAQGRTGAMRWTWEEHKRLAGYDARIARGDRMVDTHGDVGKPGETVRATDALLWRRTCRMLWQLQGAQLWSDEGSTRLVVDGFLALPIVGNLPTLSGERNAPFTHAIVQIAPQLYLGARRDAGADRHLTWLPRAVACASARARRLLTFVCMQARYGEDSGASTVRLTEATLMRVAGIRGDGRVNRRDITRARREAGDVCDEVRDTLNDGSGWSVETGATGRVYVLAMARWQLECGAMGVLPRLAVPPPDDAPTTGAELRAWRKARRFSQLGAAAALGVSVATVKRAESAPGEKLPRSFIGADWTVRPTKHTRQLGAG